MSKNRIKTPAAGRAISREEMEALVGNIARLKAHQQATTALMDKRLTEIRAEYEWELGEVGKQIAADTELVREWAEANPEAFGKLKSLDLLHGVVGWRTGTPALKTLSGWTWDRVLSVLKEVQLLQQFVRVKEDVDKQGILACREQLQPEDLRRMGVRVVQEEAFFIEPKLTEVEPK